MSFGLQEFYEIPWYIWRDMKEIYGRQYIKREELFGTDYQVPFENGILKIFR